MGTWGNIIEDMMAQMPEDLSTVALGVAEIFTNMDIETARKYIHPDFVDHEASEGVGGGPEGYLATAKYMNQAFSDASWKPQKIVASADGQHYTMVIKFSGVHTGEFMGIPATGKPFEIHHLHLFRVEDGKAIEHWGGRDELGLLRQIGVLNSSTPLPQTPGRPPSPKTRAKHAFTHPT